MYIHLALHMYMKVKFQISRASDFFHDWWAEVTNGAKNGGSFSEMMGPRIKPLKQEDQLSPNASQKYCRMLQGEHSAILSTCIKLPFVMQIFFCLF